MVGKSMRRITDRGGVKINPPTLGDITFRCIDANPRFPQKLKMILSS